jgi:hypothetical protein
MSERNKKPGWAFWTTISMVVLMLYVASIGPVLSLQTRNMLPGWCNQPLWWFYAPVRWLKTLGAEDENGFGPLGRVLKWYVDLWQ